MSKKNCNTPRRSEVYTSEINTDNYPFYRFVPVPTIGEKQQKILERYQIVKKLNEPYYTYPDTIVTYEDPPHTVDVESLEDNEINKMIESNRYILDAQRAEIEDNKMTLEEQSKQIQAQNSVIKNNGAYIQQQVYCYSHNTSVISNQCSYVLQQNAEINSNQELISSLQTQVTEIEQQVLSLQQQVEIYQSQLNYHASMFTAFNTLLQNPDYFSQLMVMAMGQQYTQA
jgi:hypothetical protein